MDGDGELANDIGAAGLMAYDYTPRPFYAPRYTADTTRLGQLYGLGGHAVAALSLQRGQAQAETMQRLAQIISGGIGEVREGRNRKEAMAIRASEREADRLERDAERKARAEERKADKEERAAEREQAAAQHTVDRLAPGPQPPAVLALVKKFPALAAQFRIQTDLPARITPGAAGEIAPVGDEYGVKEPTAEQMEAAGDRQFRKEQAAITEAARLRDDARANAAEARTGRYQDELLKIARENAETSRINAETTRQRYTGSGLDSSIPAPLLNALDRSILTITSTKRAPIVNLANRLWTEGNQDELRSVIKQAAIEGENVDTKNQVLGRQATMAALADARTVLAAMKQAGVPTNILSGTAEDIARKLGTSTNPQYVEFGNALQDALISYRRAATGVAFGKEEGAEYARMFPNYRQTLPVNEAAINGMERAMRTRDKAYWEHKLGPDGAKAILGDVITKPVKVLSITPVGQKP